MNSIGGAGNRSVPNECLTAISQDETALKNTSLAGSLNHCAARFDSREETSHDPEKCAGIE
jgi:hypothetical protein